MIDIKKLLICDGQPTQELIDFQVDRVVEKMIIDFMDESSKRSKRAYSYSDSLTSSNHQEKLLDINKKFSVADNTLCFYVKPQFHHELIDNVEKSLARYEGMLKFDPQAKDPREEDYSSYSQLNITVIDVGFCLVLEITPEMKKAMLLDKALPIKETTKKLKI